MFVCAYVYACECFRLILVYLPAWGYRAQSACIPMLLGRLSRPELVYGLDCARKADNDNDRYVCAL
jgi:hypothetical protein